MNLVTLTSDYGPRSMYTGLAKAGLLSRISNLEIIDLRHNIAPCSVTEAAYIMLNTAFLFPVGSIHIIAVDNRIRIKHKEILIAEAKGHFFISYNTGIIPFISSENPSRIWVADTYDGDHFHSVSGVFSKAVELILDGGYKKLNPAGAMAETTVFQSPNIQTDRMVGTVMFFDDRGFAYTNIHRSEVENFIKGSKVVIQLTAHDSVDKIVDHLTDSREGSAGAFYSGGGYLVIGIYHDDTRNLLDFTKGSNIIIERR
ncbi:MAG: hypothetical protein GC181_01890 [Bacteroidetes bacterium]|nr:hypothetical protein [Bacteroidota bacterium]